MKISYKRWSWKYVRYDVFAWYAFTANKCERNDGRLYWRHDTTYMFIYWNVFYSKTQVIL